MNKDIMNTTRMRTAILLSLAPAVMAYAPRAKADEQELQEKIKKLEQRVTELESKAPPSGAAAATNAPTESWLGANKFSGYISASYLYNFNRDKQVNGRLFDRFHNEFDLDKLKLVLERPVDFSPDKWGFGYRADLIIGEDARPIQPLNGPTLGTAADYEQIFVTANIPVGRGLQVSAGRMVTLLGVEVIEETANPNWSEGYQFIFAENATSTGLQLAYKFSEKIDAQVRLNNGWDVVQDNNNSLATMGRVGYAPDDKTTFALLGYGGPEEAGNNGAWRKGVELIFTRKITPKLSLSAQGDFGQEDASPQLAAATGNAHLRTQDAEWWAGGLWLTYDFTEKIGVAVRGDYFHDRNGARTSLAPSNAPFPSNNGQDISSLTGTLNYRPFKNIQVRPEFRWDHSDLGSGAFGHGTSSTGRKNQYTALLGVAFLF